VVLYYLFVAAIFEVCNLTTNYRSRTRMPRKPRFNLVGISQHVIQRGNNREPCCYSKIHGKFMGSGLTFHM